MLLMNRLNLVHGVGYSALLGLRKADVWSWIGARSNQTIAASGDPKDYLGWAPYWWPDCDWCTDNSSSTTTMSYPDSRRRRRSFRKRMDDPASAVSSQTESELAVSTTVTTAPDTTLTSVTTMSATTNSDSTVSDAMVIGAATSAGDDEISTILQTVNKHNAAKKVTTSSKQSTTMFSMTCTIASASTTGTIHCRASPTTSMSPSATYSTCPYIRRDGQVNPDVRTLPGNNAFSHATQATMLNALAYIITGSSHYSTNAVAYIRTLLLDFETGINPSAAYAQVIRGPPFDQQGGFEGVLDFRALVKVVNAVQLLRATSTSDWDAEVEQGLNDWATKYLAWLQGSQQGAKARSNGK